MYDIFSQREHVVQYCLNAFTALSDGKYQDGRPRVLAPKVVMRLRASRRKRIEQFLIKIPHSGVVITIIISVITVMPTAVKREHLSCRILSPPLARA